MAAVIAEWMSRERRRADPGGERRGVHRVVGVEHEANVEDASSFVVGLVALQHVEEVGGLGQVRDRG